MNLRSEIRHDLWDAISKPYDSKVFSGAVLEAIHLLSNVLRERANIDGDGISLVGQAFSGESPRLRINKFQTETERNEQKGLEQILRGVYQGIRNPRSHEQYEDTKETADAIILFINYIVEIISKAREPYSIEEWSKRVFDADFVSSDRYAKLLASEVPSKKYNDTLIYLYRNKNSGDGGNLQYIFKALIELAGDDKIDDFLTVISDELRTTQSDTDVKLNLQILPDRLWLRLNEAARLRIENKLIRSIECGQYDCTEDNCSVGWLGTWARDFCKWFTLKFELYQVLLKKMGGSHEEQNYVAQFFLWNLPDTVVSTPNRLKHIRTEAYVRMIVQAVSDPHGPITLRAKFLERYNFTDDWQAIILEEIKSKKDSDPEYFQSFIDDEITF